MFLLSISPSQSFPPIFPISPIHRLTADLHLPPSQPNPSILYQTTHPVIPEIRASPPRYLQHILLRIRTHPPRNQNILPKIQNATKRRTQRNTYPRIMPNLLIALSTVDSLSTVDALSASMLEFPSLGPSSCISKPCCSCTRLKSAMRPFDLFQDHRATRSPAARRS
jgi:hypothetical protein